MTQIKKTERGWAGHFIGSPNCAFRRNTLVQYGRKHVVVSTVGCYRPYGEGKPVSIGYDRYYETYAFYSDPADKVYHDIQVDQQVYAPNNVKWSISEKEMKSKEIDNIANKMHEDYVTAIEKMLINGEL